MPGTLRVRWWESRWGLVLLALLVQLPLILNPGYFSHDELQWATNSYGVAFAEIAWVNPFNLDPFQYRPLTFNLWMLLNHLFFGIPELMHAAQALFATGILMLLFPLLGHYGVTGWRRTLACLVWLCFPFVLVVHGWIGTFGDQIWLAAGLGALLACFRLPASATLWRAVLLGCAATWIGLSGKESALVIPAFLAVHALLFPDHRRVFLWATVGGALGAGLYLALRLNIILAGAAQSGDYQPTWFEVPQRIAEYWTYPATLQRLEPFGIFAEKSSRLNWSLSTLALVVLVLAGLRRRHLLALLVLPAMALGPTLVLAYPAPQYAYGFSTVLVIVLAHACKDLPKWAMLLLLPWFGLTWTHAIHVTETIRAVGHMQSVLLPSINRLVLAEPNHPIRIRPAHVDDEWRLMRSVFAVPGYHGVSWEHRVETVPTADPERLATHEMQRDGSLKALPQH